jgi:hypothetical protein
LQKQLPRTVENQHMHRPVKQATRVNLASRRASDDCVIPINQVKILLRWFLFRHRVVFAASKPDSKQNLRRDPGGSA